MLCVCPSSGAGQERRRLARWWPAAIGRRPPGALAKVLWQKRGSWSGAGRVGKMMRRGCIVQTNRDLQPSGGSPGGLHKTQLLLPPQPAARDQQQPAQGRWDGVPPAKGQAAVLVLDIH